MLPENLPNDADYLRRADSCFGPEISPSATFQITNLLCGLRLRVRLRVEVRVCVRVRVSVQP